MRKAGAEHVFSTEAKIRRPAVPRRTEADPLLPPGAAKQAGRRGIRYGGCGCGDCETRIDNYTLTTAFAMVRV